MSLILTRGLGRSRGTGTRVINILAMPADGLLYPALLDGSIEPVVELVGVLLIDEKSGQTEDDNLMGDPGSNDLTGDYQ